MSDFIQASLKAGKQIAKILSQRSPELMKRYDIGAGGDVSLGADLMSEEIFKKYLLDFGNIDSEESGWIEGKGEDIIILDPLDGSDNYLSNIPYYGASIALCDKFENVKEAVILNFSSKHAYFDDGMGIKSSDFKQKNIKVIANKDRALVKCGIFEKAYSNPQIASRLHENKLKFRSLGASALSLAMSCDMNFMLFGGEIRKYDCKGGLFLCRNLYIQNHKNFLLVSRNKQVFDIILKIMEKD